MTLRSTAPPAPPPTRRGLGRRLVPKPMSLAEAGRLGAAKRWGEHGRILRLDRLDPVTRSIVEAILTARKNAAAAEADGGTP